MARRIYKTCGRCNQGMMRSDLGSDIICIVCGFVIYGNDLSKEIKGFSIKRNSVSDYRNAKVDRRFN